MSSIKLNSSGGGSVSLSAAPTSTDVTIQFPSGNSSIGQALVAGNTSGELDWENVPTDSSKVLYQGFLNTGTMPSSGPMDADGGGTYLSPTTLPFDYIELLPSLVDVVDTHTGYDHTNHYYVIPTDGYYRFTLNLSINPNSSHGTTPRNFHSIITVTDATNTELRSFIGSVEIDNTNALIRSCYVDGVMKMFANYRVYFGYAAIADASGNHDVLQGAITNYIHPTSCATLERIRGH